MLYWGRKYLAGAMGVLITSVSLPANAGTDHDTAISCYAYVHGQCYGNGENNCSTEDYNWGLDQCDGYYPTAEVKHPEPPSGLAARPSTSKIRSTIISTFKGR